jgi:muramoyltetrapeptide carboxypeptidase
MNMKYLKGGERIGIVAPGFAVKREAIIRGASYLTSKGFQVKIGRSVFRKQGYFAGKDEERAADLNAMIRDPAVRCIVFARGGFGTSKILRKVDFDALRGDPKLLVGYSDITALFLAVNRNLGFPVFYAPVAAELGVRRLFDENSLWASLSGRRHRVSIARNQVMNDGMSEAIMEGGCLTMISTVVGSSFEPDFTGKILFWEEVGEEPYRIDRMLNHLKMAGKLDRLKGVIVGKLVKCDASKKTPGKRPVKEIIEEYFGDQDIPVIYDFPAGHCERKITIPLGGQVMIDTKAGIVEFKGA